MVFATFNADDFKAFVETGASDDEIAKWVDRNGTSKSDEEKREIEPQEECPKDRRS